MDHPSQVFRRIRRRMARPDLPRPGLEPVAPSPIQPASVQPPTPAPTVPPTPAPTDAGPSRPPRSHALYSQVMRSHDRMGTRHL